jgi:hypothetical protein
LRQGTFEGWKKDGLHDSIKAKELPWNYVASWERFGKEMVNWGYCGATT